MLLILLVFKNNSGDNRDAGALIALGLHYARILLHSTDNSYCRLYYYL